MCILSPDQSTFKPELSYCCSTCRHKSVFKFDPQHSRLFRGKSPNVDSSRYLFKVGTRGCHEPCGETAIWQQRSSKGRDARCRPSFFLNVLIIIFVSRDFDSKVGNNLVGNLTSIGGP